jgi:Concanavalin A-like lectin/glucanases superfamily
MDELTLKVPTDRVRRTITLVAACLWVGMSPSASEFPSPAAADASATGPIIDLDFWNISGPTVPDSSGHANYGVGKKGAVGFETSWSPSTTADSQGNVAVVFDGTQMQRIAIPNRSGSLDVNSYSILVQFTLDQSVDTDPLHQRYELMEKAGSFWFNVRQDTTPKYVLRTGAYFNGTARALTGTRVIPHNTLVWAIATYDGAQLKTYIANGDGSNLVLDNSKAQTGTVATGATITGIDEDLVVGAKHRKGHWVDGTGSEIAEGFFNGTMSRFIVYDTALTQSEIASVITGSAPSGKPGPVQAHFIQKSIMSSGANPTVPYKVSWTQGTCPSGSTYNVSLATGGSPTVVHRGTALSAKVNLAIGVGYTIAVDCGGGSSTTSLTLTGFQEGAAAYTGTWRRTSLAGAWGGYAKYTTAASASATFRCESCRAIAWVARQDSAHGSAKVYVDGVLKATVNTQSSVARNRVIAYKFEWATAGAHSLRIVNVATSGHPRIGVDGFVTRK